MSNRQYDNFNNLMRKLIRVPHSEVKAKMDAVKRAKAKRKAKQPSASPASGESD